LLPASSDWVDSLIGPSGLLLVISHVLAVPISVLWVGLEKKVSKYNLDVRNNFARSHTGRWWRCSKDGTVKCQVGEVLGAKCKTFSENLQYLQLQIDL
jgi:hypothetical protein